jgi:hypothetical protein
VGVEGVSERAVALTETVFLPFFWLNTVGCKPTSESTLSKTMTEFRRLYEPECVDFDEISNLLHDMLMEIDDQLID